MELHQLKPKHKLKRKKRIGRGGKRGTYSGRGIKGQRSRAGRRFQPLVRELIKKYPKLRGYRFNPKARKREPETAVLNLGILEKKFKSQEKVTPQLLLEKKLIRRMKGRVPKVKILGEGKLTKSLVIKGCQVSKGAKEKMEKVGCKIL
jgi:large subunit ribosomal protein L15